jgi:natural product precursor
MKKINLRGLQEVLSEKELKNVLGGSGGGDDWPWGGWIWHCYCNLQVGDWYCWESDWRNCGGNSYCNYGWYCAQ